MSPEMNVERESHRTSITTPNQRISLARQPNNAMLELLRIPETGVNLAEMEEESNVDVSDDALCSRVEGSGGKNSGLTSNSKSRDNGMNNSKGNSKGKGNGRSRIAGRSSSCPSEPDARDATSDNVAVDNGNGGGGSRERSNENTGSLLGRTFRSRGFLMGVGEAIKGFQRSSRQRTPTSASASPSSASKPFRVGRRKSSESVAALSNCDLLGVSPGTTAKAKSTNVAASPAAATTSAHSWNAGAHPPAASTRAPGAGQAVSPTSFSGVVHNSSNSCRNTAATRRSSLPPQQQQRNARSNNVHKVQFRTGGREGTSSRLPSPTLECQQQGGLGADTAVIGVDCAPVRDQDPADSPTASLSTLGTATDEDEELNISDLRTATMEQEKELLDLAIERSLREINFDIQEDSRNEGGLNSRGSLSSLESVPEQLTTSVATVTAEPAAAATDVVVDNCPSSNDGDDSVNDKYAQIERDMLDIALRLSLATGENRFEG